MKMLLFPKKILFDNKNLFIVLFHKIIFACKFFQIVFIRLQFIQFQPICIRLRPVKFYLRFQISDLSIILDSFKNTVIAKEKKHS